MVAIACTLLTVLGQWHNASVSQREAVTELQRAGHAVFYAHEVTRRGDQLEYVGGEPVPSIETIGPKLDTGLRSLVARNLGVDYASGACFIFFLGEPPPNAIELAANFKDLRQVCTSDPDNFDKESWLKRFPDVAIPQ